MSSAAAANSCSTSEGISFGICRAHGICLHITPQFSAAVMHPSPSQECCCMTTQYSCCSLYCAFLAVHQFTSLTHVAAAVQYEISLDAYNRLTSTPDAKGRKIEVVKVPIPYPLFRTYKEADGLHVSTC